LINVTNDSRTLSLGGIEFVIAASDLNASESGFIAAQSNDETFGAPFHVTISSTPPIAYDDAPPDGDAAEIKCADAVITVKHASFVAVITPQDRTATLHRIVNNEGPLTVVLKTALAAALPADRGFVIHSAGVVMDGKAYVFFGRSGAGKSTLSSLSPFPLLSDEHVVITDRDVPSARASGSWGEFVGEAVSGSYPLAALIEIGRGREFKLRPVSPTEATRLLLGVAQVQPLKELWVPTLGVIRHLVESIPVYHMEWAPEADIWTHIQKALA
jgi:hypothetical protein